MQQNKEQNQRKFLENLKNDLNKFGKERCGIEMKEIYYEDKDLYCVFIAEGNNDKSYTSKLKLITYPGISIDYDKIYNDYNNGKDYNYKDYVTFRMELENKMNNQQKNNQQFSKQINDKLEYKSLKQFCEQYKQQQQQQQNQQQQQK